MWLSIGVLIAVSILAVVAAISCVLSVIAWRHCSEAVTKLRSTASLHAELTEMRDYVHKVDGWLKRINQREIMRERRGDAGRIGPAAGAGSEASRGPTNESHKDALRRRAGLTAGRPAQHRADNDIDDGSNA